LQVPEEAEEAGRRPLGIPGDLLQSQCLLASGEPDKSLLISGRNIMRKELGAKACQTSSLIRHASNGLP